jgi:hypothetical protein
MMSRAQPLVSTGCIFFANFVDKKTVLVMKRLENGKQMNVVHEGGCAKKMAHEGGATDSRALAVARGTHTRWGKGYGRGVVERWGSTHMYYMPTKFSNNLIS